MNKLIPEYDKCKITLWNNEKLVIENYQKLIDISEEKIKIDRYLIKGKFLKIGELNQFVIKVYGEIKEINIE